MLNRAHPIAIGSPGNRKDNHGECFASHRPRACDLLENAQAGVREEWHGYDGPGAVICAFPQLPWDVMLVNAQDCPYPDKMRFLVLGQYLSCANRLHVRSTRSKKYA